MTALQALIDETERWRVLHRKHCRYVEAAACAIRLRALRDACNAIEGQN